VNHVDREHEIIEAMLPRLEAEGYSVYVEPPPEVLPAFMRGYQPDVVALGAPRNIAIEIIREGAITEKRVENLRKVFERVEDWELRVVYVRPTSSDVEPEAVSRTTISESLQETRKLLDEGNALPALLMSWASFEAIARILRPEKFRRPQTPGRLVEVLASEGHITPSEADLLRRLAVLRNRLVHGNLAVAVDREELNSFMLVLEAMVARLPE
jgi:Uncharacterized conserved protein